MHPLGERSRGQEVSPVLREDDAGGRLVHAVTGAPDALHAARDRGRRLDLDHEIDRSHVDAELERAGRHQRPEPPGLQIVLDAKPLLACDRPVMRVRQLFTRQIVQRVRDALREPAAVDEDERRAVLAHELEEPRVDRRPDARAPIGPRGRPAAELERLAEACHVLDRHLDGELERLSMAGIDDAHRARAVGLEPTEESSDLVQRALRRGESDALEAPTREALEPFQREREMRAALGRDDGVDLVDDDALDVAECLARGRREHEVERLGRGDEDVGRRLAEARPLPGGRVAGADRDARRADRQTKPFSSVRDTRDRRAQIALDVDGERLERRHIQDPAPASFRRRRREHQLWISSNAVWRMFARCHAAGGLLALVSL